MSKAYAITSLKIQPTTGEETIVERTVVYADDEVEATRLGGNELGHHNFRVDEIIGGDVPTDDEMNALQARLRQEVADLAGVDRAGGGAYE
jgi:hypothetical protein